MNSTISRAFFQNLRKLAKSYIAWVCGSFLLFSGSAANADWDSSDRSKLDYILQYVTEMNQNLDFVEDRLDYTKAAFILRGTETKLGTANTTLSSLLSDANSILGFLNNNSGYGSNDNLKYYLQQLIAATRQSGSLASNPWWATNSGFALTDWAYPHVFPSISITESNPILTFPQFLSKWSGFLTYPDTRTLALSAIRRDWSSYFGVNRITTSPPFPASFSGPYTWFDWMSDATRSNWVLAASAAFASSTNQIVSDLADHGFDTESDDNPTNVPLPGYHDFIREAQGDTSVAQSSARSGGQLLTTKANALANQIKPQNADATITVLPEFQFGPIHTPEYTASLDSPITSACHSIMFFLWYVILFASLWHLASVEFAFYANLGRNWTMSKGYLKETAE